MTASDKPFPPPPGAFEEASIKPPCTTSPPRLLQAPLPPSNVFAPAPPVHSVSRYFRRARERAALGVIHERTRANVSSNESIRRRQQPTFEQSAIKSALHAAENEGWNTAGVAGSQRRLPPTPSARRSGRPPRGR